MYLCLNRVTCTEYFFFSSKVRHKFRTKKNPVRPFKSDSLYIGANDLGYIINLCYILLKKIAMSITQIVEFTHYAIAFINIF